MAARPDPLSYERFWDSTMNVVAGCEPADTSCKNCYAPRLAAVLIKKKVALYMGVTIKVNGKWVWNGETNELAPHDPIWNFPFTKGVCWTPLLGPGKPNIIFLNSMADLFYHRHRPAAIHRLMENASFSRHIGLALTHYPEGMVRYFRDKPDWWRDRFWLLFSCGDQRWFDIRWEIVRPLAERGWTVGAALQPLLGKIKLPSDFLRLAKWVTVSGEQGPRSRKMDLDWMRSLRDQCFEAGVSIFIKKAEDGWLPLELCQIWELPKVRD
jgi:protein gp37